MAAKGDTQGIEAFDQGRKDGYFQFYLGKFVRAEAPSGKTRVFQGGKAGVDRHRFVYGVFGSETSQAAAKVTLGFQGDKTTQVLGEGRPGRLGRRVGFSFHRRGQGLAGDGQESGGLNWVKQAHVFPF
jgi:hypothetical protein